MESINICVCTYKRPDLLAKCLESLACMTPLKDAQVSVTVIDNDAEQTARDLVESIKSAFPFPLYFFHEAKRGIPCARNRAIDETHRLGSSYMVFIDDDEWVEKDWLKIMYEYCVAQGGKAVISGDVISELPENTSKDIDFFYQRKNRTTGTKLNSCATNNVLVPVFVTRDLGLRFDESNPLAGGTDTIFFVEAVSKGVTILKCAEALVHERVPASRTTFRWLAKRKYRAGITEAWRKRHGGRTTARILVSSLLSVIIELIKSGVMHLTGNRSAGIKYCLKACKSAGTFAGVFGLEVDSYKHIDP